MGYSRIKGLPQFFALVVKKKDFIVGSGNVFSGDIKIKGTITIEGQTKAMVIDEGTFRTKAIE